MTERERLIELLNQIRGDEIALTNDEADILIEHLLENGVIVPPCKVGDVVYWLDNGKIKSDEVFEISIHSDGILIHTGIQFCLEQVYLTREEAEAKLKEGAE